MCDPSATDTDDQLCSRFMSVRVVVDLPLSKHIELMRLVEVSSNPCSTPDGCRLVCLGGRISANSKGYIQISVRTPRNSLDTTPANQKVQLHQLVAWNAPIAEEQHRFRQAIATASLPDACALEISHRCYDKRCSNPQHLVVESSATNKSRNHCPVVLYVNGHEVPNCKHAPKCIPTEQARKDALEIHVITSQDGIVEVLESNY